MHNAKRDYCNQHNAAKLFRCWTCTKHLCKPCIQRDASGAMHVLPIRIAPPPTDDPTALTIQGAVVLSVESGIQTAPVTLRSWPLWTSSGSEAAKARDYRRSCNDLQFVRGQFSSIRSAEYLSRAIIPVAAVPNNIHPIALVEDPNDPQSTGFSNLWEIDEPRSTWISQRP